MLCALTIPELAPPAVYHEERREEAGDERLVFGGFVGCLAIRLRGGQLKKNLIIRACEKETTKRKEVPEIRRVIYCQIFIITKGRMERGPFPASSSTHPHSMGRGT
jgi:hypothetical protein